MSPPPLVFLRALPLESEVGGQRKESMKVGAP